MNNDRYKDESSDSYCYYHPKEPVIGVCPLCLHERLLVLLAATAKQRHLSSSSVSSASPRHKKKPSLLFSLGSLLINRLEFRHHKSYEDDHNNPDGYVYDYNDEDDYDDDAASGSLEDSFISIQFQDNGVGSWEKGVDLVSDRNKNHDTNNSNKNKNTKTKNKKNSHIHSYNKEDEMSVVELAKARGGSLRWRKKIGHMFQMARWKRSSKANACHVGARVEGVKVRNSKGWIRSLTKRRSTRE